MSRPAVARIDLTALADNFSRAKEAAPACRVMAVIKADAYGHGARACAHALQAADGYAVAGIDEALVLRAGGVGKPILLLGGFFHRAELPEIVQKRLDIVLHENWQLEALRGYQGALPLNVWVKVDSGMHRLGFPPERVAAVLEAVRTLPGIGTVRVLTHLACADEPGSGHVLAQLRVFDTVTAETGLERSIANSAATLGWPDAHADWVRPGIMLYGSSPFVDGDAAEDGLRPVMHLESRLIAVREVGSGESVGYGAAWTAVRAMRIGVAALGYADGYPRCLASGTPVLVDGRRAQLVGRVSMDLVTIDLTNVPVAEPGSTVRFWGEGLPADEIARAAGTIAYELFTGVTARVSRQYEYE